ncbi:MAG: PspC domain-containing protein [Bacteroidaceae bacterium]|nr:PspC domain-containing protein [Bacteroidaceae bacterium]
MKKNIQINLCGRLYQIDEDAYELLSHYTETLRNYFMKQEGGSEIADDIEQRIAELFDELMGNGTQAITIENVQSIISQIGDLKDITEGDEQDAKEKNSTDQQTQKATHLHEMLNKKKYYRDTFHSVFFGVLSGAAHYFGTGANTLRWLFVLLCIGWGIFVTVVSAVFWGPFFFIFIPVALVPEIAYFILGLCIPAASTPEESLKMKGVPVTPENLTSEVKQQNMPYTKKNDLSGWNIFTGIMSIIIAICTGISFIGCIITASILFTVLSREIPEFLDGDVVLGWTSERTTFFFYLLIACVTMIISVGIVLYCSIHSSLSSFKKAKPMSNLQRILWALGWVAALTVSIVFIILSVSSYEHLEDMQREAIEAERETQRQQYIRDDGFYHNNTDWNFLQDGRWNVVVDEGWGDGQRCTYSGEYMDGNVDKRYLDVYCDDTPAKVLIQRYDSLQPGTYRLSAVVKANDEHKCVFAILGSDNKIRLAEIPVYEAEGGPIHHVASVMLQDSFDIEVSNPDEVLAFEMLKSKTQTTLQKIADANWGNGYGWSYVVIDDLVVKQPCSITYGVTTLEEYTGMEPTTGWFSATDFKIEKMDGKAEQTKVKDVVKDEKVNDKVNDEKVDDKVKSTSGKSKKKAARRHR